MAKKPLTMERMQQICGRQGKFDRFLELAAWGQLTDESKKTTIDFMDVVEYFSNPPVKSKRVSRPPSKLSRRFFAHEIF